jgi:hypothetical protein
MWLTWNPGGAAMIAQTARAPLVGRAAGAVIIQKLIRRNQEERTAS